MGQKILYLSSLSVGFILGSQVHNFCPQLARFLKVSLTIKCITNFMVFQNLNFEILPLHSFYRFIMNTTCSNSTSKISCNSSNLLHLLSHPPIQAIIYIHQADTTVFQQVLFTFFFFFTQKPSPTPNHFSTKQVGIIPPNINPTMLSPPSCEGHIHMFHIEQKIQYAGNTMSLNLLYLYH